MSQSSIIEQGNALLSMTDTLSVLAKTIENLVMRQGYLPANLTALSEVVTGIQAVTEGLTKLLADHAKVVEMEAIVNNLSSEEN